MECAHTFSRMLEHMRFLWWFQEFIKSLFVYIAGPLCIYLSVSHSAILPVQHSSQLIHHSCRLSRPLHESTWSCNTHKLPATHEYIFRYHASALYSVLCSVISSESNRRFLLFHSRRKGTAGLYIVMEHGDIRVLPPFRFFFFFNYALLWSYLFSYLHFLLLLVLAASNVMPEIGLPQQHTNMETGKSLSPTSLSGREGEIVYLVTPLR